MICTALLDTWSTRFYGSGAGMMETPYPRTPIYYMLGTTSILQGRKESYHASISIFYAQFAMLSSHA